MSDLNPYTISLLNCVLAFANKGLEVQIGHYPAETWPKEDKNVPIGRRWRVFITGVPGTDMCVNAGLAATLEEAMRLALEEVPISWFGELGIEKPAILNATRYGDQGGQQ